MSDDYVIKELPALRLAALAAVMPQPEISVRVGPMFDQVADAINAVGGSLATPIATYEMAEEALRVVVGYVQDEAPPGTVSVDLPAGRVVSGTHHGSMATIGAAWEELMRFVAASGHTMNGPCREVYHVAESDDQADWVTELQQPIADA